MPTRGHTTYLKGCLAETRLKLGQYFPTKQVEQQ